jgi:cytoskeletal protein RodZ
MSRTAFDVHRRLVLWPVVISLSVALVACSPSGSKELCEELNSTIDRNIKEIALSEIEGSTSDKSAMQQGARLAQNNNRLTTIMANLELQSQNKCPPRQRAIDASIYSVQAAGCYSAMLGQKLANYGSDASAKKAASEKATTACEFKSWNAQVPKGAGPATDAAQVSASSEPHVKGVASSGSADSQAIEPAQTSPSSLRVEFSDTSFIEIRDATQKIIFVGEYPAGTSQNIDGQQPFQIWIGRASAVRLFRSGRSIDLKPHTREEVVRFTLK